MCFDVLPWGDWGRCIGRPTRHRLRKERLADEALLGSEVVVQVLQLHHVRLELLVFRREGVALLLEGSTLLSEVSALTLLSLELALELLYLHLLLVAAVHPDMRLLLHFHAITLLDKLQSKRDTGEDSILSGCIK